MRLTHYNLEKLVMIKVLISRPKIIRPVQFKNHVALRLFNRYLCGRKQNKKYFENDLVTNGSFCILKTKNII